MAIDSISANCKFCRIVRAEVPTDLVLEDDVSLAFLDHRPLFPGHCLLVPKEHFSTLNDLPAIQVAPVFASVQLLACAIERGLLVEGTFVAINNRVSQSVPHLHIHVVPRRKQDGLRGFFWPRQSYRDAEHRAHVLKALQEAVAQLRSSARDCNL